MSVFVIYFFKEVFKKNDLKLFHTGIKMKRNIFLMIICLLCISLANNQTKGEDSNRTMERFRKND